MDLRRYLNVIVAVLLVSMLFSGVAACSSRVFDDEGTQIVSTQQAEG